MGRVHLFEFLDQAWLPAGLRSAATLYLVAAYRTTPFPTLWAQVVARVLDECKLDQIVDLGSGAAGPMAMVLDQLHKMGRRPRVMLTDLYPVTADLRRASEHSDLIDYWPNPVNAACVPAELHGLRTVFTSFHHFDPPTARAVLRDAFEHRQPICICEATSRTPAAIAGSLLIPLLVLLLTPRVRPLSAFQIVFTYLLPVLPLLSLWDGVVSQLRTYSRAELEELTGDCKSPDYCWESALISAPGMVGKPCYLIGYPRRAAVEVSNS